MARSRWETNHRGLDPHHRNNVARARPLARILGDRIGSNRHRADLGRCCAYCFRHRDASSGRTPQTHGCDIQRQPMDVAAVGTMGYKNKDLRFANLIVGNKTTTHPIPEFVPHFGAVQPVADQLDRLIYDPAARKKQYVAFKQIADLYAGRSFGDDSAKQLLHLLDKPLNHAKTTRP